MRLTGSGLGCPDWPKCYGKAVAPLETHAVIEYGNRILSGLVGLAPSRPACSPGSGGPSAATSPGSARCCPSASSARRCSAASPCSNHLAPGFVMGHFGLSMLILVAAVALAWRASYEPGERPRATDRVSVWAVRALVPLGAVTIFAGTAATAAGPHAGGHDDERINRLDFKGGGTLDWAIHQHARIAAAMGSRPSSCG